MQDDALRALATDPELAEDDDEGLDFVQIGTWLGDAKWLIVQVSVAFAVLSAGVAYLLPPVYTARTSLLPPGSQTQGGSAGALAALGSLGALAGVSAKTPDELYVALLRSDSVLRALDAQFDLKAHYEVKDFESLRKAAAKFVRIGSDKKVSLITLEVDDEKPKFAADLANAHVDAVSKLLARLAVSEAQQRRQFFERQLKETKENLVKAETDLQDVQQRSGVIVLDKQAEAIISGAAQVRAAIADREIRLRVLRTSSTEQSPDVIRLSSELQGLRAELSRLESRQGGAGGNALDLPVGKLPEASVAYVRARRELKLQEALLEVMVRQYEAAKLDEAKEGPLLQQVDPALPPDRKSKPARALIVAGATLVGLLVACFWVVRRGYAGLAMAEKPERQQAWQRMKAAWGFGRRQSA